MRISRAGLRKGIGLAALATVAAGGITASASAETVTVGGYSYGEAAFNAPDGQLSGGKILCPSGRPVVGGGIDSSGGFDDAMTIYTTRPTDGPDGDATPDDGWFGQVDRSDFGSEAQTVRTYAICDALKPASSYAYVKKTVSVADGTQSTVTVACPVGEPVVGGGVASTGGYSERMWVHGTSPYDGPDADKAQDDGWRAAVANVTTSGFPSRITVYAICDRSRPQSSYAYVRKAFILSEAQQRRSDVLCPSGSRVVGGGVSAGGNYDDKVFINTSRPLDTADADGAEDDGWRVAVDNSEGIVSDHTSNLVTENAICRR